MCFRQVRGTFSTPLSDHLEKRHLLSPWALLPLKCHLMSPAIRSGLANSPSPWSALSTWGALLVCVRLLLAHNRSVGWQRMWSLGLHVQLWRINENRTVHAGGPALLATFELCIERCRSWLLSITMESLFWAFQKSTCRWSYSVRQCGHTSAVAWFCVRFIYTAVWCYLMSIKW